MKNDDWQELLEELRRIDVQVPLHQKALRDRLLSMDPYQRRSSAAKTKLVPGRLPVTFKRVLLVGVFVVAVGAIVLGLLIFLPHTGTTKMPAKKLIAKAAQTVEALDPKEAAASQQYEDIKARLKEAGSSDSLQVATTAGADTLVDPAIRNEHQPTEAYLAYSPPESQTVVIAVETNQPLFAVDVSTSVAGADVSVAVDVGNNRNNGNGNGNGNGNANRNGNGNANKNKDKGKPDKPKGLGIAVGL